MFSDHRAILEITYCLIAAVTLVPLFNRLGLGSILAYLFAGIVLGPFGFGFITHGDSVTALSDIGIIFLFFIIGLEISPQRLVALKEKIFIHGSTQVLLTTFVFTLSLHLYKFSIPEAILIGFALAISSTAYALNVLKDNNDIAHNYGQMSMSILLYQDLIVIPVLFLIPLLSPFASASIKFSLGDLFKAIGVFALFSFVGLVLLKKFIQYIHKTQSNEIFLASCLLVVLATATIMKWVGFSTGLGAFMAGVLLANSEVKLEIKKTILPFKGLLMGIFFIKIGMGLNFLVVFHSFEKIMFFTIFILAVKFVILYLIAKKQNYENMKSVKLGILLSEAGEFSFIILAAAFNNKILQEQTYSFLITTVTMSMFIAPILFKVIKSYEKERPFVTTEKEAEIILLHSDKKSIPSPCVSEQFDQAA